MLNIAYYLLKVITCSGILYGYYRLALHNKIFHRWNRFYLLAAVIMSLSFPLIKINVWRTPSENDGQVIKLLNVVTTGDEMVVEADKNGSFHITGEQGISILYVLVSMVLLVLLIRSLQRLYNLIRRHRVQRIERINFVDTEAKGTPFSFFRYIFWNRHIDINSDSGKRIFLHELVHVHEKHSADRLLMNIVLIFFWCNPLFWLIRREMNMIHEFIADSKTVEDSNTGAFAAMILHAAYPQQVFGLTSNFFNSSIKRRLLMLTKMKNPRVSYIGRILALPLLTFIFLAFTIKTKTIVPQGNETIKLERVFTVVVDAGHGGEDRGAKAKDGTTEKSLTLAIAQKIKQLNTNTNIRVLLSRETDILQSVRDKVKWTLEQKPDAFISIHINVSEEQNTKNSGFDLYVSRQHNPFDKQSRLLGSLITKEIAQTYTVAPELKQRKELGIWVLDAPDITYPAVLIQCGYINNAKDLAFISNTSNQEKIAEDILVALERFAKESQTMVPGLSSFEPPVPKAEGNIKEQAGNPDRIVFTTAARNTIATQDTLPANIKSIDFTNDDNVIIIYKNDKAEKISRAEAVKRGIVAPPKANTNINFKGPALDSVLYVIDGEIIPAGNINNVNPNDIESIYVLKNGAAFEKYGAKGSNGVIEIITKKQNTAVQEQRVDNIIFSKVETEATFPGGESAWVKYISNALQKDIQTLRQEGKSGYCIVQFIVSRDGKISDVKALTMNDTKLAEAAVNAIKNGPDWEPARQNGIKVNSYRKQPVSFQKENP